MDWRLPTKYEWNEMFVQKGAIGGFNFQAVYWSSTEKDDDGFAWNFDFYYGRAFSNYKDYPYYVRAVRAF
jgi:hypothetical protein